jgi:phosphoglucomutase/phosphomannomutase
MVSELAWDAKNNHQDLIDRLHELYKEFGAYYTPTLNLNFLPEEKDSKIDPIMKTLRTQGLKELAGLKVIKIEDYWPGLYNMPGQNLMKIYFNDGSWIAIRPSGTEPKLKIYFNVVAKNYHEAEKKSQTLETNFKKLLQI